MKYSFLCLSACLTILSFPLKAQTNFQPAYIINLQSDTLFGEIDDRGDARNCRICIFRSGEGQEPVSYKPGDILAYRFSRNGKYYISREVENGDDTQSVFLEYLVKGIYDLYYYRGQGYERYYLESVDGQLIELSNDVVRLNVNGLEYKKNSNLYVGQMRASFSDCPEIQSKLDRARFSHKSLMQLTTEYHEYLCEGEECIIYEKSLPAILVSGGVYTGMARSGLNFPDYEGSDTDFAYDASYKWYHYYDFRKQNDLLIGLRLSFTLPGFNEKLALLLLGEYSQSDYTAYKEVQESTSLLTLMEASAHLSTLNLMTGIQYTFPKGKLRPSLALGPVFSVDLNSYFDMQHTLLTGTVEITQDYHTNPVNGLVMGGFAQVGLDWSIRGPHGLGVNLKYYSTRQRTTYFINRDAISCSLYYTCRFN